MNTLFKTLLDRIQGIRRAMAPDDFSSWNSAAGVMRMEGYTEFEIEQMLGRCPKPEPRFDPSDSVY